MNSDSKYGPMELEYNLTTIYAIVPVISEFLFLTLLNSGTKLH